MEKITDVGSFICKVCDSDQGVATTLEGERLVTRCSCGALVARPALLPRKAIAA